MTLPVEPLGVGVFETFKAVRDAGRILVTALESHLSRLRAGATELALAISPAITVENIKKKLATSIAACENAVEYRCRVVATPEELRIDVSPFAPRLPVEGVCLMPVALRRPVAHLKSCSTIVSYIAQLHATKGGAHEALLVGEDGVPRECSWSNFFWFDRNGALYTPATGMLPGITRSLILEMHGNKVHQVDAPLQLVLSECSEIFITNSLHDVCSVKTIGELQLSVSERTWTIKKKLVTLRETRATSFNLLS